jgi:hypothetical protein
MTFTAHRFPLQRQLSICTRSLTSWPPKRMFHPSLRFHEVFGHESEDFLLTAGGVVSAAGRSLYGNNPVAIDTFRLLEGLFRWRLLVGSVTRPSVSMCRMAVLARGRKQVLEKIRYRAPSLLRMDYRRAEERVGESGTGSVRNARSSRRPLRGGFYDIANLVGGVEE